MDRFGPIGIVHEQSPWTTHNGLRFAVEALSGGLLTRIVSASVNYIRVNCGKCPSPLLNRGLEPGLDGEAGKRGNGTQADPVIGDFRAVDIGPGFQVVD